LNIPRPGTYDTIDMRHAILFIFSLAFFSTGCVAGFQTSLGLAVDSNGSVGPMIKLTGLVGAGGTLSDGDGERFWVGFNPGIGTGLLFNDRATELVLDAGGLSFIYTPPEPTGWGVTANLGARFALRWPDEGVRRDRAGFSVSVACLRGLGGPDAEADSGIFHHLGPVIDGAFLWSVDDAEQDDGMLFMGFAGVAYQFLSFTKIHFGPEDNQAVTAPQP